MRWPWGGPDSNAPKAMEETEPGGSKVEGQQGTGINSM